MARFTHKPRKMNNSEPPVSTPRLAVGVPSSSKAVMKTKAIGVRLWMRMDRNGESEVIECDKRVIINRTSIPARDLRILGPILSQTSRIYAREKAILVNLEFIRAIITNEEVHLLDPLQQEVLPFVHHLTSKLQDTSIPDNEARPSSSRKLSRGYEDLEDELPFEFRVLEMALEVVCAYLDSNVSDLERDAYPALDELGRNVNTKNLEYVRSLKSNLTRLLSRVQKVRSEIEHLLDDDKYMNELYVTRKTLQLQHGTLCEYDGRIGSPSMKINRKGYDVEDLEMLLEAYFMQLDSMCNKILGVREYINDTEDYINIQLDNKRNLLIQLQLTLVISMFTLGINNLLVGFFGMNIPSTLKEIHGVFGQANAVMSIFSLMCGLLLFWYARWKKLLGS